MLNDCHRQVHDERCRIKSLLSGGLSICGIAGDRNRSPGMVGREIARIRRYGASDIPRKLTGEPWHCIRALPAAVDRASKYMIPDGMATAPVTRALTQHMDPHR